MSQMESFWLSLAGYSGDSFPTRRTIMDEKSLGPQQQFETLLNLINYNISITETIMEQIMALRPEVQALVDADTAMGTAIAASVAQMTNLAASVTALQSEVTALQNQSGVIDATDLQGIVNATNTIQQQTAALQTVLPTPLPVATPAVSGRAVPRA
jgi:hypothetical protein